MELLFAAASLGGASWALICLIISLILLFIAAFFIDAVGDRPRIAFGWAGMFFFVLSIALSGSP